MSETRKIAAILVSDVVGYSRLAGADEERILARLRALRSDLIDPTISVHRGRVVKRTGDGSVIEFNSVVDAVRCAIEVQRAMVERNAGVAPDNRIAFRIGIHLGDIVEESDGDLMGDGVNIAARLEGVCEPGGVCLSEDAHRQVRDRLKENFVDLGERQLKNIARPVRAYALPAAAIIGSKDQGPRATRVSALRGGGHWIGVIAACVAALLAVGAFAWRAGYAPRFIAASVDDKIANAPRLSIVVLPFENLSGDKEQDYFADGITDDLTTDLSHLPDSFVIARNTAFTYKGKPVDAKQIGKDLGVRYLLEGSVRQLGEKVEVNAQLISTETGAHVWADRFDGERSKLGELQVEFVSRLANSLGVELVKAESLRAMRERPNNPDATDLAMRGLAILNGTETLAGDNEAIGLFERALSLDANNVQALMGLSFVLTSRANNFADDDAAGHLARAEQAVDAALAIQPDNSSAHLAKSLVYQDKHQWGPAIAEAEKAIADDRNNAGALAQAGFYKMFLGHAEDGFADVETALRLSPRDPAVTWWQYHICHIHSHLAQWEQAIEWCNKSVASGNQTQWPYTDLAAAHGWLGHMKEAKEAAAQVLKFDPDFTIQGWIDHWSDDPTFNAQLRRIVEGARKAGIPEREAKSN
jgi:adenylate cyclase